MALNVAAYSHASVLCAGSRRGGTSRPCPTVAELTAYVNTTRIVRPAVGRLKAFRLRTAVLECRRPYEAVGVLRS